MKISIITATWNSAATVRDTIESVLAQDYADFEHIIVDGESKDETMAIIHEYESKYNGRLKVLMGKDNGLYDAMNKGIAAASGDVIGILNSDDFYASNGVLSLISKEISSVDTVYANLDFVDQQNTDKVVRIWRGSQHTPGAFLKGWHPAHPTFYARKELFDKLGGFDINLDVSADFELMLRFLEKGKASSKFIDKVVVKMRYGGESTGSISKILQGNKNVRLAFEKNGFKVPPFYTLRRLSSKALKLIKTKIGL